MDEIFFSGPSSSNDHWHWHEWMPIREKKSHTFVSYCNRNGKLTSPSKWKSLREEEEEEEIGASEIDAFFITYFECHTFSTRKLVKLKPLYKYVLKKENWNKVVLVRLCFKWENIQQTKSFKRTWKRLLSWIICGGFIFFSEWYLIP